MAGGNTVTAQEHWTRKGAVKLFLWEKFQVEPVSARGTILFVHGLATDL